MLWWKGIWRPPCPTLILNSLQCLDSFPTTLQKGHHSLQGGEETARGIKERVGTGVSDDTGASTLMVSIHWSDSDFWDDKRQPEYFPWKLFHILKERSCILYVQVPSHSLVKPRLGLLLLLLTLQCGNKHWVSESKWVWPGWLVSSCLTTCKYKISSLLWKTKHTPKHTQWKPLKICCTCWC
jgi:hypothetical protein